MANKTYTVTLIDGAQASRKSARPYTHAVVVRYTEAHLEQRLGHVALEILKRRNIIAGNAARAATDEDKAAYAAASERFAYLNEKVTQQVVAGE